MAKVTVTDENNSRRGEYNNNRYSRRNRTDKGPTPTGQRQRLAAQKRGTAKVTSGSQVGRYRGVQGRAAANVTQSGFTSMFGQGQRPTIGRGGSVPKGRNALAIIGEMLYQDIFNRPLADGTLAGKPQPMASMGSEYKTQEKELARQAVIHSFDTAFAKARKEGKKEFTWRGNRYTTQLK